MGIKKLYEKVQEVEEKYRNSLHLIANENIVSNTVFEIANTPLSYRYNFTQSDNNTFVSGGFCMKALNEFNEFIEEGKSILKKRLGAAHVFINCLSGSHAMMSSLLLSTNPGDAVMTVPSPQGGHFLTKNILEKSGRIQVDTVYDFDKFNFDPIGIGKVVRENNVKCIYFDVSTQLNFIPVKEIREQVGEDVVIICDLSHTLGLVLGGISPSPLAEGADIITGNTHKTLPGTHKGIIAFKDKDYGIIMEKNILSTTMSTNHTGQTLGLCGAIIEVDNYIEKYSKRVVDVANMLGIFFDEEGFLVRKNMKGKYTENHQIHVYIPKNLQHTDVINMLIDSGIYTSTSRSLSTSRDQFFLRIGVQEIVYRNFTDNDIRLIPKLIKLSLKGENQQEIVKALVNKYPTFISYN